MFYLIFLREGHGICPLASYCPGQGPMWSGVWQCLWKDTESYPPALPLLSPAPSPPRPRWLPLGFPGYGKSGSPACAHSPVWVGLSSGPAAAPVPGPEGSRVWWTGPGLGMGALGRLTQGPPFNPRGVLRRGCYLQLGLEDHNQDGEGDTHCHAVRQAQEEGGEEAHHPDAL